MTAITGKARARKGDPATSHAAAKSIKKPQLRASQQAIIKVLTRFGRGGATDQDIARYYNMSGWQEALPQSPSGLRTRRSELVDAGLVVDSGKRKRLSSGRNAIVWVKAPAKRAKKAA